MIEIIVPGIFFLVVAGLVVHGNLQKHKHRQRLRLSGREVNWNEVLSRLSGNDGFLVENHTNASFPDSICWLDVFDSKNELLFDAVERRGQLVRMRPSVRSLRRILSERDLASRLLRLDDVVLSD